MGLQYVTKVVLSLVACQTLVAAYPARDHSSFLHSSQLPSVVVSEGVGIMMYLPEYNAFLVPAENLLQPTLVSRRRPVPNYVNYGKYGSGDKEILKAIDYAKKDSKKNVDLKGSFMGYYGNLEGGFIIEPKFRNAGETLTGKEDFAEQMSQAVEETSAAVLGSGGARLTLRPVAKAVAGPRGVAVASPVAQAVLRRNDPAPQLTYRPDAVALAGPGGHAYSHPKLLVTYIDGDDEHSTESASPTTSTPPSTTTS